MLKILIIDDEQVVRVYLQSIVNWEQYDCQVVTTCGNGIEALEVMAQQPIDLILTDLEMPKMNGLQLIEEIRSRGYQTKVIVLSDHSDYDLIREAMKLGALDYYVKNNVNEVDIISMIQLVSEEVKKQLLQKVLLSGHILFLIQLLVKKDGLKIKSVGGIVLQTVVGQKVGNI